jgi:hypothetical protein
MITAVDPYLSSCKRFKVNDIVEDEHRPPEESHGSDQNQLSGSQDSIKELKGKSSATMVDVIKLN